MTFTHTRTRTRSLRAVLLGMTAFSMSAIAFDPAGAAGPTGRDLTQAILAAPIPGPRQASSMAHDLGEVEATRPLTLTIYLMPRDPVALETFVASLQTRGDPLFHKFITTAQFTATYGPTEGAIAHVESALRQAGLFPVRLFDNHLALRVSGQAGKLSATLGLRLHDMSRAGHVGIRSLTAPALPASIAAYVRGVGGIDMLIPSAGSVASSAASSDHTLSDVRLAPAVVAASGVSHEAGYLTPLDYEKLYDVTPLVQAGATGKGITVGIVTEQNFNVSDPATFYSNNGIPVADGHVIKRDVDGGLNGSTAGATESDLDTEQAGSIAPAAQIVAYVTPGGVSHLLDGYEAAASANVADVVSSSFGTPELYFSAGFVADAATLPGAFHDVFCEMATQGQTVFVAGGDAGAFAVNRDESGYFPLFTGPGQAPAYTPVYSVNAIAADPLVTAAGGTELPFTARYGDAPGEYAGFDIAVQQEQPWSLSYYPLQALAQGRTLTEVLDLFEIVFPTGGGGGVSTRWPTPRYQRGLSGLAQTMPNQVLIRLGAKPETLGSEPGGFAGRNIPDLSANADGAVGYRLFSDGKAGHGGGGTSFVAPQFAGTMALIVERLGHRVGQLNPLLYSLSAAGAAPARDITVGDNWGYTAHTGYDQTTGLGVMDAQRLYVGLKSVD